MTLFFAKKAIKEKFKFISIDIDAGKINYAHKYWMTLKDYASISVHPTTYIAYVDIHTKRIMLTLNIAP